MKENKYKLGVLTANTKKGLGVGAIKHLGLMLPNDENIGKRCKVLKPKTPWMRRTFIIIAKQKVWGYNNKGNYVDGCEGYRLVPLSEPDDFGMPIQANEIKILP